MSLLGIVASAFGARKQNKANAAEAARARAFNERLSRNKHQYETEDLKKAGLNRILSITNGATAGSSSAQARHENVGEAGVKGAQLGLLQPQIDLLKQQTATAKSAERLNIVKGTQGKGSKSYIGGRVIQGAETHFEPKVKDWWKNEGSTSAKSAYDSTKDWINKRNKKAFGRFF